MATVKILVIEGDLNSSQFQVSASIDGTQLSLQLDTGSTYTSLPSSPFLQTYKVIGTMTRRSASGLPSNEEKIQINDFRMGDFSKSKVEVVRYDPKKHPTGRIGMDVLGGHKLFFDLVENELTLDDLSNVNLHPQYDIISYRGNTFGMELSMGSQQFQALWDTGAELSVIDQKWIQNNSKDFEFIQDIHSGFDATGNSVAFKLYRMRGLKIGSKTFDDVVMSMNFDTIHAHISPSIVMIVGANIIRNHRWYFDLLNKKWDVLK